MLTLFAWPSMIIDSVANRPINYKLT
jgi:hypothetical protein